jgi:hypothetical protein
MRPLRHIIILLWCLAYMTLAGTMTLAWDENPAARFEVYRGIEKLATVTACEAVITIPDHELSTLHVIAYLGDASATSEPFTVQPFRVRHSSDLTNWTYERTLYHEAAPSKFYQVEFIKP